MCDGPIAEQQNVAARYKNPKSRPLGWTEADAGLETHFAGHVFAGLRVNADPLLIRVVGDSIDVLVGVAVVLVTDVDGRRRRPPLFTDSGFGELINEISILSVRHLQQIIGSAVILRTLKPEGRQIRNSVAVRSLIDCVAVGQHINMIEHLVD